MSRPNVGLTCFPNVGQISDMKLAEYMSTNNLSPEAMASLIGEVTASGVKKWVYGERTPRPDQMRRIAEATDGKVTPNDFVLSEAAE